MNLPEYPTPWQRKTIWTAVTAIALVTIGSISVGLIWIGSHALSFLQPILIPFAVAGVMAYLLEPAVSRMVGWGWSRQASVLTVFASVTIAFVGVMIWIVPAISEQSGNLARKVPSYANRARREIMDGVLYLQKQYGIAVLPPILKQVAPEPQPAALPEQEQSKTTPVQAATVGSDSLPPPVPAKAAAPTPESGSDQAYDFNHLMNGEWLKESLLALGRNMWSIIHTSLGGFLGVVGFLVSLVIVPIYLYYFLTEAPRISAGWSHYLPIRASAFKDEVVSVLSEINGYLIAFFRGQLVVSFINGSITGLGLVIAGLDFGLLIGIALCFLGIVPYLGIAMAWLVSLVIASVQGGSWCVPAQPWWVFPLVISGVFVIVHHIDGLFVTPKIVGESVGLHPLTVILSVFVWSLLMGGLLGAILAVPMTATMKVLLRRYIWERRFRGAEPMAPPREPETTLVIQIAPEPEEVSVRYEEAAAGAVRIPVSP